VFVCVV